MKRKLSVMLAAALLLTAVCAPVPAAGAAPAAQEEVRAEICGEGSAYAEALPDVFAPVPGAEAPASPESGMLQSKSDLVSTGTDKAAEDYSYEIKPLLAPFNTFFFVKTDNPDPLSFRFADKDSVYFEEEGAVDSISVYKDFYTDEPVIFADVQYEDESTGRVAGGYIFKSDHYDTDGGRITLQYLKGYSWRDKDWNDTKVTVTLPKLVDNVGYLIDTFADKDSFFENMDAVQAGFDSICFYSGSYIRGKVQRTNPYWMLARAGHLDQSYYIYSPYDRLDDRSLFASAIYPYRYDSLGFPGMMAAVAERLDSTSDYKWNENHWLVDITYNGTTKSYGGAGRIKGQGVDEDDILRVFTLGKGDAPITLEGSAQLLKDYASLKIEDDIPRDDQLTFKFICDTVGDGAWVRMVGSNISVGGHYNVSNSVYTYLYSKDDLDYINDDEWGVGNRNYWGGKMGYFRDAWVDGRYVGKWRMFEQGEKFEDHPNSNIFVLSTELPLISYSVQYKYNYEERKYDRIYSVTGITEVKKNVLFRYNSTDDMWYAAIDEIDRAYASYSTAKILADIGLLDASYLDKLSLTRDEVLAMDPDRNTDTLPDRGYSFDGTTVPGTPFGFAYLLGDVDGNGEIDVVDAGFIQRSAASVETPFSDAELLHGDVDGNGKADLVDATAIQYYAAEMKTGLNIGRIIED